MFCVKTMDFKNICLLIALVQGCMARCRFPGAPAHSEIIFSNDQLVEGTVATYSCERGFELLGPARRVCENGIWLPDGIPFCVLNVAAGKAPMQISTEDGGIPQRALDGSTSAVFSPDTCTLTKPERVPWWYVNLLEPYMVQLVRLDFGKSCCGDKIQAEVVVRVGNSRPDLGTNPTCNHFTGSIEEGQPLFLPCNPPMPGAFVSVHLESSTPIQLSICEAFVYTDQALPIERCPQFRDQPPGSTATYNGKCYIFYDRQPATFMDSLNFCRSRGGTLVDESNPALQGFISWELWRRHRSDVSSHYWMGAIRDKNDKVNWKWLNGDDVTVSFWNAPGGNADCARFDGGKGWLWADTDCNARLNFICQHQPKACGKPEQPPGSQMTTDHFQVGASVQYSCDDGHLLLGPAVRTCQETGFYDEYPPFCKRIDCGFPGDLKHGKYELLNGSVSYLSHVQYSCDEGYEMVGRSRLVCDIDERWNGPPPKCAVVQCENPPQVLNGRVVNPKNISLFGTTVEYSCHRGYKLVGVKRIECLANGTWDKPAPQCQLEERTTARTTTTTTITTVSSSPTPTVIIPSSTPRITATRRPYSSPTPFTSSPVKKVRPKTTTEKVKVADKHPDIEDIHLSPTSHLPHIIVAPTPIDNNQKGHKHLVSTETTPVAKSTDDKAQIIRAKHELSFGAMLALGIIGCLLFLIAVIVSTVVLFKNCSKKKNKRQRYRHHVGPDCTNTVASVESSSSRSTSGLNKYYVQAWEELHEAAAVKKNRRLDREAPKDESELVVSDMYPGHLGRDKRKRHHHHHHREPQADWAAANQSRHNHRSRRHFPM